MSGSEGGGIFLSYRRQESSHVAGRLYDRLTDHFGVARVFMDVDTIEPIKFGEWRTVVAIDGERVGSTFNRDSRVLVVNSLSSRLGCLVTFEVRPSLHDPP